MKTTHIEAGALVKVKAWGGVKLTRRVVSVREDTVAVCSDEEYEAAKKEGRKPTAIGFNINNVALIEP